MALFRKKPDLAGETERTINRAEAETEEVYGPPGRLCVSIVTGAQGVWVELGPVFGYSSGGTPPEQAIYLLFEMLYFFAHITLRLATANQYSEHQIAMLQAVIGPLLASTAVDSFFSHWPDGHKAGIRNDFFAKLSEADREYAECRMLDSQDDLLSMKPLVDRVATNVCALWERDQDSAALAHALSAITRAMSTMQLPGQVEHVKAVIDRVDRTAIEDYWRRGPNER